MGLWLRLWNNCILPIEVLEVDSGGRGGRHFSGSAAPRPHCTLVAKIVDGDLGDHGDFAARDVVAMTPRESSSRFAEGVGFQKLVARFGVLLMETWKMQGVSF